MFVGELGEASVVPDNFKYRRGAQNIVRQIVRARTPGSLCPRKLSNIKPASTVKRVGIDIDRFVIKKVHSWRTSAFRCKSEQVATPNGVIPDTMGPRQRASVNTNRSWMRVAWF